MKCITPAELLVWQKEGKEYQLIDVREPYEIAVASMGGVSIPMEQIPDRLQEIRTDIPVIIHCQSGRRSEAVVYWIEGKRPCDNLFSLKGGIIAWNELQAK